jgi:hypothetical protein
MSGTFTKRHGLGSSKGAPIYDDAPTGLRIGFWNLIEDLVEHNIVPTGLPYYAGLYNKITAAFHIERVERPVCKDELKSLVLYIFKWNEVFDLIQYLFTEVHYCEYDQGPEEWFEVPPKFADARYKYTIKVNSILSTENIGWTLKNGILERSGNEVITGAVLAKARSLLTNPLYKGPEDQFSHALKFYNQRPKADKVNCIKEAVGALEGLARVLLQDSSITLGKAIEKLVSKGVIKKPFDRTFHALFGYASELPGARHGAAKVPEIDMNETEFVLYTSASCMLLLASRYQPPAAILEKPTISRAKLPKKPIVFDFPEEDIPPDAPAGKKEEPDVPPDDDDIVPF